MASVKQIPDRDEFAGLYGLQVAELGTPPTVLLAPGGTSRWYFFEHASAAKGYADAKRFRDYGRRTIQRIVELADMMFHDGVQTVFVVGFVEGVDARDKDYNRNLRSGYGMLVDSESMALYEEFGMAPLFRGGWVELLTRLGILDVLDEFRKAEAALPGRDRWLVWTVKDNAVLPAELAPMLAESLANGGAIPDRRALCRAYYGRDLDHIDILIGNNKPSVRDLLPPLVTAGDVYFTINPTFYMDRGQWRAILYDHLFARRGHYREYPRIEAKAMAALKVFYRDNMGMTLGVGARDEQTGIWKPTLPEDQSERRSKRGW